MFNLQSLIQQIIYRTLALAIIFCLSGLANVVCCFAKCEIGTKEFFTQTSDSGCHKSETVNLIAESSSCSVESSSCSLKNSGSCSLKESCEESSEDSSLETISLEEEEIDNCEESEQDGYLNGSSCKMSCCLPSDDVVDITPIPRLYGDITVNHLRLVSSNATSKNKTCLLWPVENLPSQEKTYLRCCVFLI